MKIKHFAGYGYVDAKRISTHKNDSTYDVTIKVKGNHEWGIHREDTYDVVRWLGKVEKSLTDYRKVISCDLTDGYEDGIETCLYHIVYKIA